MSREPGAGSRASGVGSRDGGEEVGGGRFGWRSGFGRGRRERGWSRPNVQTRRVPIERVNGFFEILRTIRSAGRLKREMGENGGGRMGGGGYSKIDINTFSCGITEYLYGTMDPACSNPVVGWRGGVPDTALVRDGSPCGQVLGTCRLTRMNVISGSGIVF